jgi:hypothetical protein
MSGLDLELEVAVRGSMGRRLAGDKRRWLNGGGS